MIRHNLALPVTVSPLLRAAASVAHLLLFCPGDYLSRQSTVPFGRAPPLS